MSHRASYAEKGKAIASSSNNPRVSRIKAPESDNSELLLRHKLTLIGRVTNPAVQRVWSILPFFTEHWKTSSRPLGADLGHGLFQFQFASEEDLQLVLDNRPYHSAGYMLIIQRWEPTISRSFPSEIPFWIQVTRIPVHLWTEELISSIGEDIGRVTELDVTVTMARMRVHINGLLPLVKTSIVEFQNGEEIEAELIYERLKKYCKVCHRLDHEDKDCPTLKPNRALRPPPPPPRGRNGKFHQSSGSIPRPDRHEVQSHRVVEKHPVPRRSSDLPRDSRNWERHPTSQTYRRSTPLHYGSRSHTSGHQDRSLPSSRNRVRAEDYGDGSSRHSDEQRSRYYSSSSRFKPRDKEYFLHRETSSKRATSGHFRDNATPSKGLRQSKEDGFDHPNLSPSRSHPPFLRNSPGSRRVDRRLEEAEGETGPCRGIPAAQIPQAALAVALEEVREVMDNYANCADPAESAARKERLRQADLQGQFEETAEQMVRANLSLPLSPRLSSPEFVESVGRVPVALRLGPSAVLVPPQRPKKRAVAKRKQGKQPGRPPGRGQGKKKLQPSPLLGVGGRTKKRKLLQSQPNSCRRLNMDSLLDSDAVRRGDLSEHIPQRQSGSEVGALASSSRPNSVGVMDFRNPPNLLP